MGLGHRGQLNVHGRRLLFRTIHAGLPAAWHELREDLLRHLLRSEKPNNGGLPALQISGRHSVRANEYEVF